MAKLIWFDQQQVREFRIPERGFVTVGRTEDNEIRLDDPQVSKRHLRLVSGPHGCMLSDLQSVNGVFVNGREAHRLFLKDGDVIRIGNQILEYHSEDSPSLIFPAPSQKTQASAVPNPSPKTETRRPRKAYLRFVGGPARGRVAAVDRSLLALGSGRASPAAIKRRADGYRLLILDPNQRVLLNGQPLAGKSHPLEEGDLIATGPHLIEFHLSDETVKDGDTSVPV